MTYIAQNYTLLSAQKEDHLSQDAYAYADEETEEEMMSVDDVMILPIVRCIFFNKNMESENENDDSECSF